MVDHEDQSKDGGIAKTPRGAAIAKAAFEAALRRGSEGDLNKDPQEDTGSFQTRE